MGVRLCAHDPTWSDAFLREADALGGAVEGVWGALHHIGSTAVPGILAKPIIDMLGVVERLDWVDQNTHALEQLDYEAMGAYGIDGRRYFRKSDAGGVRSHHLHVFQAGSAHIERHLAFREYLRGHADVAQRYSELKAALASQVDATWETYIDGKARFIAEIEPRALAWYQSERAI